MKKNSCITSGNARFTVITPELIRMEYAANGRFIDTPSIFAWNRNTACKAFTTTSKKNTTIIRTKNCTLSYTADGKPFSPKNLNAVITCGTRKIRWTPGMKNKNNLGGTVRTLDAVNRAVPLEEGLLSRDGWYCIDDSKGVLFKNGWFQERTDKENIDWYLFAYGQDFKSAFKALTAVSGPTPIPRKYTLGVWYSRYWPYTSEDYRNIVREFKQHGFPLDIMVFDMDWHRHGWTGWSWNRELLPDIEDLLTWMHKHKVFTTLNTHPADSVAPHEDMYEAFMKDMGRDPLKKETIPFDASDKKYTENLFKHTHTPHEDIGVDFWWLDWQQALYTKGMPLLKNLQVLNYYYFKHTSRRKLRGQSFSRWAGWGDHRYPIHFSGDTYTGWPILEFIVPFTATAGNVGCFFWSHDIGGHLGPRNEEVYARWVQFGLTSASLRLHSTRSTHLDRRPWLCTEQIRNSIHKSFLTRSLLIPYIYSSIRQCHTEAVPLNRPMYIEYPGQEKAYNNPQQYLFGDTFLAAPAASAGQGEGKVALQKVWFPKGTWYNFFTGEKYTGDTDAVVASTINESPLYARAGIPIPMQHYTSRMTTEPLKELIIRCYPGENTKTGTYTLYEDDGVSDAYQQGKFATTELRYIRKGDHVTVVIDPAKGTYRGIPQKRSYVIELPCTEECSKAVIKGRKLNMEYDASTFTNRISIPPQKLSQKITVTMTVREINPFIIKEKYAISRIGQIVPDIPAGRSLDKMLDNCTRTNIQPAVMETILAICGIFVINEKPVGFSICNNSRLVRNKHFAVSVADHYNGGQRLILNKKYTLSGCKPSLIKQKGLYEMSYPYGISAERRLQADFYAGDIKISLLKNIDEKTDYLKNWNLLGIFPYDPLKTVSEHQHMIENEPVNLNTHIQREDGSDTRWVTIDPEGNRINLHNYYHTRVAQKSLAYLVTYIYSEKEQEVTLDINYSGKLEVWHNSIKVFTNDTATFYDLDPARITVQLKPGYNELLCKFPKVGWWWELTAAIKTKYPVKNLISIPADKK